MLNTISKDLNISQRLQLERFADRVNTYGVNFAFCNVDGELAMLCEGDRFKSNDGKLSNFGRRVLKQADQDCENAQTGKIWRLEEDGLILAAVLRSSVARLGVIIVESDEPSGDERLLREMLALLAEDFKAISRAEEQIEMVSTELSQVYEELVLLHKLSTNMKVTESDFNYLQIACDNLTEIVGVEGIAILLDKSENGNKEMILAAGGGLIDIDEQLAAILLCRLKEEMSNGKEVLLDSEVDCPFKYDWSDNVENIIAVPLYGKGKNGSDVSGDTEGESSYITGMMVAINRTGKRDFDSIDVKLFNSVANSCAVFIENGNLFKDLKELFIGSLKALTNSIDAKDPYTRGHSERVAFISKWIAEKLSEQEHLPAEQIQKIYLAGLLHDIGKIGIDEVVLRKEGKLTEEEFDHIKMHPSIGASILSGIKQMNEVVPGILWHHERIDGKGYPNRLTGERIPLIGKIVGLADSFDAMTSKRTYREAMTLEQAIDEIEKELGKQFDEKIGRIFLKSDMNYLWDVMMDGFKKTYGADSFEEYGIIAVGALIK